MTNLSITESLFWDINPDRLDADKNKRIIIERVFTLGDIPDVKAIIKYYGIETIKKEIIKSGNLDNKTLSWLSIFLQIPKEKFKCYTKRQSKKVHWNF